MKSLSDQKKGSLLAFIGVMFITPDSLLIRLSNLETWGLLFYRGIIPFFVVLLGLVFFYKKNFLKALFNIGYAGWSAGQLEQEIKNGDWLLTPASSQFIFNVPHNKMWEKSTHSLGLDINEIYGQSGEA